jgi:hypothetical protein
MKLGWEPVKWLGKKAKQGFRGYPIGTIAFYGPDNKRASKVAVGIALGPDAEPDDLRRWFAETRDARADRTILGEIATFLRDHAVRSVVMTDRILGCPHEEGIDYPEDTACPRCPYWAGRDRWAGALEVD